MSNEKITVALGVLLALSIDVEIAWPFGVPLGFGWEWLPTGGLLAVVGVGLLASVDHEAPRAVIFVLMAVSLAILGARAMAVI